ncbi:efflux RND transporter permease subunit, partial [Acinetobacter baumannii]
MKDVAKVQLFGIIEDKIFIEFSTKKLATLGLTPQAIFDTVGKQNVVVGAGAIETGADKVQVRVTGAFKGADA